MAASTVSGTLTVSSAGAITDTGVLSVTGAASFGAGAGNGITLDNANNFASVLITSGKDVTLNDVNGLILVASTVSGNLVITAGGAVSQSGALSVSGSTSLSAAGFDVTLSNSGNDFGGAVSVTGNNVSLADRTAIALGASAVSGTLTVRSTGSITDTGVLSVGGAASFGAAAGNAITLDNANDFASVLITYGRDVTLNDVNGLVFAASSISGNLIVTAGGAVSQSGALAVSGTTSLTARTAGTPDLYYDIALTNASNDFVGAVSATGKNVTLVDKNAIALGLKTVTGNLVVTAGGAVTNTDALLITGTTSVTATGFDVTLSNSGNDFGGAVSVTGNNVSLADMTAIALGAVSYTHLTLPTKRIV